MIPIPLSENLPTSQPKNTGSPALINYIIDIPLAHAINYVELQTNLDNGVFHGLDLSVHVYGRIRCNRTRNEGNIQSTGRPPQTLPSLSTV